MINRDPRLPSKQFSWFQRSTYKAFQVLDHFMGRRTVVKLLGGVRYRAFMHMARTLQQQGEGTIIDVEYHTALDLERFKSYHVKHGIPVVFKGAAKDWPSVKHWTLDHLKALHGTDEVPLLTAEGNNPEGGIEFTTLARVIERIQAGDHRAYFRFYNMLTRHPEHLEDFDQEWLKARSHRQKYFSSFQVFIGGAHSRTELHNSHIANLFVQVHGVKEWVLYPNHYVPFLDPISTMNGIYRNTPARAGGKQFSPFTPDYEGYPWYRYLDGYRVVLEPGDVLYNPPYMWHTVFNRTDSIGIGFRWINAWHSLRSSPVYYLLDLMAFRPNYFKSIAMVRRDANEQFIHRLRMMERKKKK